MIVALKNQGARQSTGSLENTLPRIRNKVSSSVPKGENQKVLTQLC